LAPISEQYLGALRFLHRSGLSVSIARAGHQCRDLISIESMQAVNLDAQFDMRARLFG